LVRRSCCSRLKIQTAIMHRLNVKWQTDIMHRLKSNYGSNCHHAHAASQAPRCFALKSCAKHVRLLKLLHWQTPAVALLPFNLLIVKCMYKHMIWGTSMRLQVTDSIHFLPGSGEDDDLRCKLCGRRCKSAKDLSKHFKQLHEREFNKKLKHKCARPGFIYETVCALCVVAGLLGVDASSLSRLAGRTRAHTHTLTHTHSLCRLVGQGVAS